MKKLTLLTIDCSRYDDRDYIVCYTEKTEEQLKEIIEKYMKNFPDNDAYEITEMLERYGIIKDATNKLNHYWVEI
jgi:hypothetical protein